MNKRGQATIFIILGIVIVIAVVSLVVLRKPEIIRGRLSTAQVEPIREYVEECIMGKAEEDINLLRIYGGKFEENIGSEGIHYYWDRKGTPQTRDDVRANVHYGLPTIEAIKEQLVLRMREYLVSNCNLDSFRARYDSIEQNGEIEVDVEIDPSTVSYKVSYPLIIRRGDVSFDLDEYLVVLSDDFYTDFRIAQVEMEAVTTWDLPDCSVLTEYADIFGERGGLSMSGPISCFENKIDGVGYLFYIRTQQDVDEGRSAFSFVAAEGYP